jgi:hypothetical protein
MRAAHREQCLQAVLPSSLAALDLARSGKDSRRSTFAARPTPIARNTSGGYYTCLLVLPDHSVWLGMSRCCLATYTAYTQSFLLPFMPSWHGPGSFTRVLMLPVCLYNLVWLGLASLTWICCLFTLSLTAMVLPACQILPGLFVLFYLGGA